MAVPKHIGIILDGNGRWAKKRGLPRLAGHKAGVGAIKRTLLACEKYGIKIVTLFCFSTENWKRDKEEVDGIFNLIYEYLQDIEKMVDEHDCQIRHMGEKGDLPQKVQDILIKLEEKTKKHKKTILNLAINYGGRAEIVRACNLALSQGKDKITEKDIEDNLYSKGLPLPDLIIRTSGEKRLSNFMLFQCAYSELYFPSVMWPDFGAKQLKKAIEEYSKRERRFGKS